MGKVKLPAPELLTESHNTADFDCGTELLNAWLKNHATANQQKRVSRSYVVQLSGVVKGYYSLAAGSISHAQAAGKLRRNMPDPIPMALLGRLAVDKSIKGQGYGHGLLKDALTRVYAASELIGLRGVLVDAIDDQASAFYQRFGFRTTPMLPLKLMISLEDIERSIKSQH